MSGCGRQERINGTLWLASITLPSECLHLAWTVEPARTETISELGVVGLGGPLQATLSEVTSVMGPL